MGELPPGRSLDPGRGDRRALSAGERSQRSLVATLPLSVALVVVSGIALLLPSVLLRLRRTR